MSTNAQSRRVFTWPSDTAIGSWAGVVMPHMCVDAVDLALGQRPLALRRRLAVAYACRLLIAA